MPSAKVFIDQPVHCIMLLRSTIFFFFSLSCISYYGSVGSSLERPLHQELFEQAMTGVAEDVIAQQILLKVKHAHTTLFSVMVGYLLCKIIYIISCIQWQMFVYFYSSFQRYSFHCV